jgi:hypothetical protein
VGAEKERPPPRPNRGDGLEHERHPDRLDNGFNDNAGPSQDAPPPAVELVHAISPIAFGPEDLLSTVVNMADWGASHLRSASESAWRGDFELLGDHLRQASNALKAAQMTYAVIEGRVMAKAADTGLTSA